MVQRAVLGCNMLRCVGTWFAVRQHVALGCNTLYGVATQHAAVAARLYAMPQIV
jgi:hypothetical protein